MSYIKHIFLPVLIIFSLFIFSNCENTITNPNQIIFPDSNVSFQRHVMPFLSYTCSYIGCHSADYAEGGYKFVDWFSLYEYPGFLIPYKPDNSVFMEMVDGKLPHNPYVYMNITDNHKKGLRRWINEGAKNN